MFKRWMLYIVTAVVLALLLAITAAFFQAHRARTEAARYIRVVTPLRMGAAFDLVVAQLHDANISTTCLPDEPPHECILSFRFNDKWLYLLHLAPPAELIGRLDFRDDKLVYKSTAMGREMCCSAAVLESPSTISRASHGNVDSSGHPWILTVELSPLDFTEYRKQAYAFNLACIGSMRVCKTDEYLPTLHDLERGTPK
jgi:hypothetical protein